MDFQGQRFCLDLSDDEDSSSQERDHPFKLVSDIKERPTLTAQAPSAPKFKKTTTTGFPEHKQQIKVSAFKQQRLSTPSAKLGTPTVSKPAQANEIQPNKKDVSFHEAERRHIDEENRQRLEAMSAEQIEEERQELFSTLDPSLIEQLLRRANIDEGRGDTGLYPEEDCKVSKVTTQPKEKPENGLPTAAPPKEAEPLRRDDDLSGAPVPIPEPSGKHQKASRTVTFLDEDEEPTEPIDALPTSQQADLPSQPTIHFPVSQPTPDLDPSDPEFLTNLHTKYFPTLPADPSKLAWMAPLPTPRSPADLSSPYSPQQTGLPPSALRFNFKGALLPPRIARAIPVTKGLHHHGEAPEAAGYTIPELARLARSAFPAQRCLAFQVLGRVLYRLGRGEWSGDATDGDAGEIEKGLWRCMEEGRVIEGLEAAGNAEGGHLGSKSYALEALWLYHKGGGKVWRNA